MEQGIQNNSTYRNLFNEEGVESKSFVTSQGEFGERSVMNSFSESVDGSVRTGVAENQPFSPIINLFQFEMETEDVVSQVDVDQFCLYVKKHFIDEKVSVIKGMDRRFQAELAQAGAERLNQMREQRSAFLGSAKGIVESAGLTEIFSAFITKPNSGYFVGPCRHVRRHLFEGKITVKHLEAFILNSFIIRGRDLIKKKITEFSEHDQKQCLQAIEQFLAQSFRKVSKEMLNSMITEVMDDIIFYVLAKHYATEASQLIKVVRNRLKEEGKTDQNAEMVAQYIIDSRKQYLASKIEWINAWSQSLKGSESGIERLSNIRNVMNSITIEDFLDFISTAKINEIKKI